jgi:hypothetical protein
VKSSEQEPAEEIAGLNDARDEVSKALSATQATQAPEPIEALNAQPLGEELHPTLPEILDEQSEHNTGIAPDAAKSDQPEVKNPTAPPPVPPPLPLFGNQNRPKQ